MSYRIDHDQTGHIEFAQIKKMNSINCRIFFLFFLFVFVIYSNSFKAGFHLDDFRNITQNTTLHIKNLSLSSLYSVISGNAETGKLFFRPVSYLSFALNWYFGKDDVTGYHIVNITIHILISFFLYLTILALFDSPNLKDKYRQDTYFIAGLAACLWAVNPIQTQAVTYIVQRMAALATLFSIMAIFLYINARISQSLKNKAVFFSGMAICFLLAVGSKENALLLPVSLFLVEMFFFQNMADPATRKKIIGLGGIVFLMVLFMGVFLFLNGEFFSRILGGYEKRTFTVSERLMTQPRVILFYLSQMFFPVSDRFSIDHDMVVSTGLFSPWTTLPAILTVLGLAGFALWRMIQMPLIGFAILFFLTNHLVESSIIPLEMVFEHRNYLPSLFLFLPVAAGLIHLVNHYSAERKAMKGLVIGFITMWLAVSGFATYTRNMVWKDEQTLWEDALEKAPGRSRPYLNLASVYQKTDPDRAIPLYQAAMHLKDDTRHKPEIVSLINLANMTAARHHNHELAIQMYHRILELNPGFYPARYHLAQSLIETGDMAAADKQIKKLLAKNPESINFLTIQAVILLRQHHVNMALPHLINAVKLTPENETIWILLGAARYLSGRHGAAENLFEKAYRLSDKKMTALLLLIQNSVQSGDRQKAGRYAGQLVSIFGAASITESLRQISHSKLAWLLSKDLLVPVISDAMAAQARKISQISTSAHEIQ
jgi:tetratricopeptide (TPR) repeat protein